MPFRELQLVSIGGVTANTLKELEAPLQTVLGVTCFIGKASMPTPQYAFNKDRAQYHSTSVMRRVLTLKEPGVPWVLGVCDVDLFVPDTPFVFGEADRESKVALVSLFRLRGEGEVLKRRLHGEATHQAAHLVGLSFCEDSRCLMYAASTLAEADRRQLHLCNNCRNELAKQRRT